MCVCLHICANVERLHIQICLRSCQRAFARPAASVMGAIVLRRAFPCRELNFIDFASIELLDSHVGLYRGAHKLTNSNDAC